MAYLNPAAGAKRETRTVAGAPTTGTDEVQTLTIGGTPTSGTFTLVYSGQTTAAITWSNVNATLIAAIDAALEALVNIGTGGVTTAVGTMTAGIGTATITFTGTNAKKNADLITVGTNSLVGTSPTLAVATTTPGVNASGRGAPVGAQMTDTTSGILYINTGTSSVPVWTKVGLQS
jgi:hypothetical protein